MSNEALSRPEVLRLLGEICTEAAQGHGRDYAAAWARLCARLDALPTHQRAQVDGALREILRFRTPPTRASQ